MVTDKQVVSARHLTMRRKRGKRERTHRLELDGDLTLKHLACNHVCGAGTMLPNTIGLHGFDPTQIPYLWAVFEFQACEQFTISMFAQFLCMAGLVMSLLFP